MNIFAFIKLMVLALIGKLIWGAVGDVSFESDGDAVDVDLLYTVGANEVVYAEGWLGLTSAPGDSGDTVALSIAQKEYQIAVPSGLSVSKGDTIYIEIADLTGHTPNSTAYSTSSGAGKVAFMKATSAKDGNNIVTGILIVK